MGVTALATCLALAYGPPAARAADEPVPVADSTFAGDEPEVDVTPVPAVAAEAAPARPKLEALNPELAEHPYRLAPGVRPFQHRFSFSPAFGTFGSNELYSARLTYSPSPWLGYEASLGHTPGQSTHAVIHQLSALLRVPLPGRLQPYLSGGYGMIVVFPGPSLNADPVTKNALAYGGGLELYIRDDLSLRAEMRGATVFGRERDREGVVVYDYLQQTVGLAFHRTIRP
jgi:hypothetical protein